MRTSLTVIALSLSALAFSACGGTYTVDGTDGGGAVGDGGGGGAVSDGGAVSPAPPIDGPVVTPDAGGDSAPPPAPTEALYYGACRWSLAAGRLDRALSFYTEVTVSPGADGAAAISLKFTSLLLGAGSAPPATVAKALTTGATYAATSSLGAKGVYAAELGTVVIPGAANPLSGRDITIEQTAVPGRYAAGKFCSQLRGHVVTPTDTPLDGDMNTCIYYRVKEGDPTPRPTTADFAAGCPME